MGMSGKEERGILPVPADMIVGKELTIVGSMGMQARCYPEMLRMIEAGVIKNGGQVFQIVAGYQDGFAFSGAQLHLGRHRVAIG